MRWFLALAVGGFIACERPQASVAPAAPVVAPITDATLVFPEPLVPRPAYLTQLTPLPLNLPVTRIAADPTLPLTTSSGPGTWGTIARHHYSKDQPWNSDGTLLVLQNNGSPSKLYLDGQTYLPLVGRCSGYDGDDRWHPSPLHPRERINVSSSGTELMWFDVMSCVKTRSWALPDTLIRDRKSTRLNSSHLVISYAVFCLKKKK